MPSTPRPLERFCLVSFEAPKVSWSRPRSVGSGSSAVRGCLTVPLELLLSSRMSPLSVAVDRIGVTTAGFRRSGCLGSIRMGFWWTSWRRHWDCYRRADDRCASSSSEARGAVGPGPDRWRASARRHGAGAPEFTGVLDLERLSSALSDLDILVVPDEVGPSSRRRYPRRRPCSRPADRRLRDAQRVAEPRPGAGRSIGARHSAEGRRYARPFAPRRVARAELGARASAFYAAELDPLKVADRLLAFLRQLRPGESSMRILRVADVPDVRTGGMQRVMYGTGDVLRSQGHTVEYLFKEGLRAPGPEKLRRFTVPVRVPLIVRELARRGRQYDVLEVHEPLAAMCCVMRRVDQRGSPCRRVLVWAGGAGAPGCCSTTDGGRACRSP